MTEPLSIKRRKAGNSDVSFDSLRSEAIKLIQQLSGHVWSDYNLHDPGITVLEQLIYAITDLIYRTEFAIEDYLASEDGSIDLEAQVLHHPAEIFSCRATTKLDYRKLLLNKVAVADNVWLSAMPEHPTSRQCRGLYSVSVKLQQGLDRHLRDNAIHQLRAAYLGARNLCEDLGEIKVIDNLEYELCASVEVKSDRQPVDILAEIYFACARRIASSVNITNYDQLTDEIPPLDQLFDGPFTDFGFFMDHDLPEQQSEFLVSTLFSVINSIEGVDYVKQLYMGRGEDKFYDTIDSTGSGPDKAFDLHLPRLIEEVKVELTRNGRVLKIPLQQVLARYDELNYKYQTSRSILQDNTLLYQAIKGESRTFSQYYSIQNQLPANYGINMQGIPKSAPIEVKAKARQFKAYLVIFEQLMANFMTNLDSIQSLFSLRTDVPTSYSVQTLTEQQVGDLSAVYPTDANNVLSRIVAGFDNYYERKGRLLDYLLALYGERFSQNSLRHFNYYCREDEVEQVIMANKVAYLESIVKLGRDRAAASDYSVTSEHPKSGLALRVAMLLGFEQDQSGQLTEAILSLGIELRSHHAYKEIKADSDDFRLFNFQPLDGSRLKSVEQAQLLDNNKLTSVDQYLENITETILVKNALLSERLLREGIYLERYCIAQFDSHQDYVLTFKIDDNTLWQLGIYKDRASANLAANNLRQCLLLLNQASEGLHVIEHILLRPQQKGESSVTDLVEDEDFFSFRLSVIFPSWTSRCHDEHFRTLAKETLHINAPAHISPEIYWLDFAQMQEFEEIYHYWMRVKSDKDYNAEELDRSAQLLVTFLSEQRNTQQTDI
jgi:hypothetical protein